jgi:hypothetical protein
LFLPTCTKARTSKLSPEFDRRRAACLHGNKTQIYGKRNRENKKKERKRMAMRITF